MDKVKAIEDEMVSVQYPSASSARRICKGHYGISWCSSCLVVRGECGWKYRWREVILAALGVMRAY